MPAGVCHRCKQCPCECVVSDYDLALEELWTNAKRLHAAGDDALTILARHSARYVTGLNTYSALDLKKDRRKFLEELRDELDDSLFYIEAELKRSGG